MNDQMALSLVQRGDTKAKKEACKELGHGWPGNMLVYFVTRWYHSHHLLPGWSFKLKGNRRESVQLKGESKRIVQVKGESKRIVQVKRKSKRIVQIKGESKQICLS